MYGCQEVVLLVVEHVVVHRHAGRNEFGDAALDQFLGEFGVFQLVADGHTHAGTYQFGQISVEGMIGETGHLGSRLGAAASVGAACEGDTEHA